MAKVCKVHPTRFLRANRHYRVRGVEWPIEAYCHTIVGEREPYTPTGPGEDQNVLRLLTWRKVGDPYFEDRYYTEYAPFGTVTDLIAAYKGPKTRMV